MCLQQRYMMEGGEGVASQIGNESESERIILFMISCRENQTWESDGHDSN